MKKLQAIGILIMIIGCILLYLIGYDGYGWYKFISGTIAGAGLVLVVLSFEEKKVKELKI